MSIPQQKLMLVLKKTHILVCAEKETQQSPEFVGMTMALPHHRLVLVLKYTQAHSLCTSMFCTVIQTVK